MVKKYLPEFYCSKCGEDNKVKEGERLGKCPCGNDTWHRNWEKETPQQRRQVV